MFLIRENSQKIIFLKHFEKNPKISGSYFFDIKNNQTVILNNFKTS